MDHHWVRKLATSWQKKGIKIDAGPLNNLRFADDIVLFAYTSAEIRQMLQKLSKASLEVGFLMKAGDIDTWKKMEENFASLWDNIS